MEMDDKEKRVAESPVSVSAASDISNSSRPNKRKRKGTAPTRHVQQVKSLSMKSFFGNLTRHFRHFDRANKVSFYDIYAKFSPMGRKKRIIRRQIQLKKMQTR